MTSLAIGSLPARPVVIDVEAPGLPPNQTPKLSSLRLHLSYFKRDWSSDTITLSSAKLSQPRHWLKVPLLWLLIGKFEFTFLAWAAQYVETAIVSTMLILASNFLLRLGGMRGTTRTRG